MWWVLVSVLLRSWGQDEAWGPVPRGGEWRGVGCRCLAEAAALGRGGGDRVRSVVGLAVVHFRGCSRGVLSYHVRAHETGSVCWG